jgi:hydroxypyruvate isomerase
MAAKYAINCSIMFTELPLLERPAAAKAAGFDAVEFWWPFHAAVPGDGEATSFVRAIRDAGVQLIGLNFFAGDMAAGERGLVSWPARAMEFRDNLPAVVDIGHQLGCEAFNALYGNRLPGITEQDQDDIAVENLALAGQAVSGLGGTVLLEPVSGAAQYPLRVAGDVFSVIDRVRREKGTQNLGFLCDLYHLAANGDNLDRVVAEYGDRIAHVQIADAPGRHEPGTGDVDLARLVEEIHTLGYKGWTALEYKPSTTTADSFGWITETAAAQK